MNSQEIMKVIGEKRLPIRVFGSGEEVTHVVVGRLVGRDAEEHVVCLFAQNKRAASDEFVHYLKSAACQCGQHKIEGLPLCGLCFGNLRIDLQNALRSNRAGELEETYRFALTTITRREIRRAGGRRKEVK